MSNGFNIDALIDAMAERVAGKVRADLAALGRVASVRPRLLTVEQAATYLGRSDEAVRHMIHAGKIPIVRADRRIYLDVEDLDRWIESNKEST